VNAIALPEPANQRSLLRRVLLADGIVSGVAGAQLALAAGWLDDLLGLPTLLLQLVGLSLLPFAAGVLYLASRAPIQRRAAWAVLALNVLWVVASALLVLSGWVDPTTAGTLFIVAQAIAVVAFIDMQFLGLRREA
jgi:hypothetical protein